MCDKKRQKIEARLKKVEADLANAHEYVARNVNVESLSFLHFADWHGKSGHPLWMKNHMIPTVMKHRARKEKALQLLAKKDKDKKLTRRKRQGWAEAAERSHRAGDDQLLIADVFEDDIQVESWSS
jgi:hypothetical protein